MKRIFKILLASTLLFSSFSFANETKCPSVGKIRNVEFTQAVKGALVDWIAYSKTISEKGTEWTVAVFVDNKNIKTAEEASLYIQSQIKKVPFIKAQATQEGNVIQCIYSDEHSSFGVAAISPPFQSNFVRHL
jgi:hypothetical protein